MVQEGGFGGASGGVDEDGATIRMGLGGEKTGRRGGLGVWYQTKGEGEKKGQETDFVATSPMAPSVVPNPAGSLRNDISTVMYAMPTDTLKDKMDEGSEKGFQIRHQLLRKHGRVRMNTTHRDAHIYLFPYWVAQMMWLNDRFDSISEDVVGWWAKAYWQSGLGEKLKLRDILLSDAPVTAEDLVNSTQVEAEVDVADLSTTQLRQQPQLQTTKLATRAQNPELRALEVQEPLVVPPMLGYIQPSDPTLPLIRRVDTAHLLLNISLRLAKLPSLDSDEATTPPSPLSHTSKVAPSANVDEHCRIEKADSLIAENVTVEKHALIKESVIGANCTIGEGVKLTRCLLMDGAAVGSYCQLTGCILGRRCKIEGGERMHSGDRTNLKDCEVQDGYVVPWETDAKGEKFMVFEGLSDEDIDEDDAGTGDDEMEDGTFSVSER